MAAHVHRDGHEGPAAGADVALLAARAHVVVVRQVDVKDKLALHGGKHAVRGEAYINLIPVVIPSCVCSSSLFCPPGFCDKHAVGGEACIHLIPVLPFMFFHCHCVAILDSVINMRSASKDGLRHMFNDTALGTSLRRFPQFSNRNFPC